MPLRLFFFLLHDAADSKPRCSLHTGRSSSPFASGLRSEYHFPRSALAGSRLNKQSDIPATYGTPHGPKDPSWRGGVNRIERKVAGVGRGIYSLIATYFISLISPFLHRRYLHPSAEPGERVAPSRAYKSPSARGPVYARLIGRHVQKILAKDLGTYEAAVAQHGRRAAL